MFFAAKKQSISRATRSGLWQISPALGTTLISIGSYIVTARALGPEAFGIFAFVQWLATITVPLVGIGMSALTSRQIVEIQSQEPQPTIAGIFYYLWYHQCRRILLYGLIFLCYAFPLSWLFGVCTLLRLMLTGLATLPLFLSSIVGITLRSARRLDLLGTLHLFGVLTMLFLIVVATKIGEGQLEIFLLAVALATTLTLIMAVVCLARLLPMKEVKAPRSYLRERLKRCFKPSFLHFTLDAIVWQRSESLLLALWYTPTELAFYAISSMVSITVMQLTPMLLSGWILPLFLRRAHQKHYHSPYDAFVKTSCYMAFIAVALCIIIMALGPYVITYSIGPAYLPLMEPLRIMLIAGAFGSIATVSMTHLTNKGHRTTMLNTIAATINIGLAIPLVAHWGITGAALASTIAQIFAASCSILMCRKVLVAQQAAEQKEAL